MYQRLVFVKHWKAKNRKCFPLDNKLLKIYPCNNNKPEKQKWSFVEKIGHTYRESRDVVMEATMLDVLSLDMDQPIKDIDI